MKEFLRYFFYRVYSWQLKLWGESNSPQTVGNITITFMIFLNLMTIAIILQKLDIVLLFGKNRVSNFYILIVGTILYSSVSFWINRNGGYTKIAKLYKDESRKIRNLKLLYIWLYIIVSFALPILLIKLFW